MKQNHGKHCVLFPNNALNCRSLRSLGRQKLRFCLPVSLIVMQQHMAPCEFRAANGTTQVLDLDAVVDIVAGQSKRKPGWSALVVLEPFSLVFVELRDGPQDFRGDCESEAEEVDDTYLAHAFSLSAADLFALRANRLRRPVTSTLGRK
jgi:hypothetical protein